MDLILPPLPVSSGSFISIELILLSGMVTAVEILQPLTSQNLQEFRYFGWKNSRQVDSSRVS